MDGLANQGQDAPLEQSLVALALAKRGRAEEALARLAPIRRRYHDSGELWTAMAIALQFHERPGEARAAAREAAKSGASDQFRDELIAAVFPAAEWAQWEARFAPPLEADEAWLKSPGAALVPADGDAPHSWGGERWSTSPCLGCGHPIQVWFTIDLAQVPGLSTRLVGWRHFPLLDSNGLRFPSTTRAASNTTSPAPAAASSASSPSPAEAL